jgi:choline dehydrogenase-like flavoprotein
MIVDFRTLPDGSAIDADLCIIGAGPAGITIAREFIGTGVRVCLLESGGYEPDDDTQALCEGDNVGRPYYDLAGTRIRNLGGTSYHWSGRSAPFRSIEFAPRDWVPDSGWPINRKQLDPFYRRAQKTCELGVFEYGPENWKHIGFDAPEFDPNKLQTRFWRYSPPTRFGPKYRGELESADNISVYLNASVSDIQAAPNGNFIERVNLKSLEGTSGQVTARNFVVACGGLDNPRMLLASNTVEAAGLGNRNDLVGRYFMEHLEVDTGEIVPRDSTALIRRFARNRTHEEMIHAGLVASESQQKLRRILSNGVTIEYRPDVESGVGAAKQIVTELSGGRNPGDLGTKLWRILADIDEVLPAAYGRLVKGEPLVSGVKSMYLFTRSEQAPNPDSRVTLASEKDATGMNRVRLDWRLTPLDKHTIRETALIIGSELGRLNLARFRLPEWLERDDQYWTSSLRGGNHHMGTTRMSNSPKQGVVDKNCRVHNIGNLYMAGSSVFTTSGYVNPTFTIVALASRLADHLKLEFA